MKDKLDFVLDLVYGSYQAAGHPKGNDALTRDISVTQSLFEELGIAFTGWPSVTVTGSKGKGSTSVMIASVLQQSGHRVGLVTSPHMRHFNERIRVNGQCVSDDDLLEAAHHISKAVHAVANDLSAPKYLGPGGVILAMAHRIFSKAGVSAIVVEAGRGGEFDEARLIIPQVSVITPVMLEHQDSLGSTKEEIATTKAKIVTPNTTLISAHQSPEVYTALERVAKNRNARFIMTDSAVRVTNEMTTPDGMMCDFLVEEKNYENIKIPLSGEHQIQNAATALLAAQALLKATVSDGALRKALGNSKWPGRAQLLQKNPWVFLDGAINKESAEFVAKIVKQFPGKRTVAVIAVPKPKDIVGVFEEIARVTDSAIITTVTNPALAWYDDAENLAKKYFKEVRYIPHAQDAFEESLKDTDGVILLGTQSFVGEALKNWGVETCKLW